MPEDRDFDGYLRSQLRFTGLACDGKPILGVLTYVDEFGSRTIEQGRFGESI